MSWFSIPITSVSDGEGVTLLLEAGPNDGELSVQDSCVVAIADAYGLPNPWLAKIEGTLDCETGAFEGTMAGQFTLLTSGVSFPFEGPISGSLDGGRIDGMWRVKESTDDNAPGGEGIWNAAWQGELADAPALAEGCQGLPN